MEKQIFKILLAFLLFSGILYCQSDTLTKAVGEPVKTVILNPESKSPLGAVLRSAIIPGWGQLYNHSYWKAPVVWGFMGTYVYYWIYENKKYQQYADSALVYARANNISQFNKNKNLREFYHDARDLFSIYMGITYVLNLLDAYVDAQLFDFSVEPDPPTKSMRLFFQVKF